MGKELIVSKFMGKNMNSEPLKKTVKKYFPKKGCENQLIILPLQSEIQEIILKITE